MNERIKNLRKALGLTQQEFADRLGISRNNIATYETRNSAPGSSVIALICREFNVNEEWLRTGEGEMFIQSPSGFLDALAQEYGLSRRGTIIVEKFLDLKPEIQEAVADYIEKVAAAFSADSGAVPDVPVSPLLLTDDEIDSSVAEYRRELLLEREAAEKSSASSGQKDA